MKLLIYFVIIALINGCSSLMNPQMQPVESLGQNNYKTTCSGTVETWGTCQMKAKQTCINGYEVSDQVASSSGVHRSLTFHCL